MARRQYKRLHIALPVTISGLDSNGNHYVQSATTIEIGVNGMRLSGVRCFRAPGGEPVQVEYQGRHARYRVAWIGAQDSPEDGLVGLQGLEGARFLFSDHLQTTTCSLAGAEPDTYTAQPLRHLPPGRILPQSNTVTMPGATKSGGVIRATTAPASRNCGRTGASTPSPAASTRSAAEAAMSK